MELKKEARSMKTVKIFIFFLAFLIAANISYAFQTNSSNYKMFPLIVSSGGKKVDSGSYKSYVAAGIINGIIGSSTYKNWLGFFYTWLLADNQPCTSASQCQGGYCCSSLCKSSACPVAEAAAAAGGGGEAGGGGGGLLPTEKLMEFQVSPDNIKVKLTLGESAEKKLKIKNTGSEALTVFLSVEGIKKYLYLSEDSVNVNAGEEAEVGLEFTGRQTGSFPGEIIATADGIEKSIPIIIEVISELVLFDVKLDIPANYEEVEPGDELKIQITLLNVGAPEKVDVFATYLIKDLRGNVIYEETETFAVEKQASYMKSFKIHESTPLGSYVAAVEIRYADSFAVSSQLFRVVGKKSADAMERITQNTKIMLLLVFLLAGVIFMLAHNLISITRKAKGKKKP